jgi:4-hydroxybenzoate polyprenyltransferase
MTGLAGSLITFPMLEKEMMTGFLIAGLLTLSYSLPMIRRKGQFIRMREITYLKVFTVAFGWTFITVVIPLLPVLEIISMEEMIIILLRRFLFIYAITIPFEIRDMERERRFGNISLPMIYGIRKMKSVGIIMLVLFCILSAVQEKYFLFDVASRKPIFIPLLVSATTAAFLIMNASDKKTNWYFKFWTDGTMILQFLLLLLFSQYL